MEDNDQDKKEINLKYTDKEKLKEEVIVMNKVLEHVKITGITLCRNVLQAAMKSIGKKLARRNRKQRKQRKHSGKNEILSDVSKLRKDLSRIEDQTKKVAGSEV